MKKDKSDIIMYVILGITCVLAIFIGFKLGLRTKTVLYLLVAIEAIVYLVITEIIKIFKK